MPVQGCTLPLPLPLRRRTKGVTGSYVMCVHCQNVIDRLESRKRIRVRAVPLGSIEDVHKETNLLGICEERNHI